MCQSTENVVDLHRSVKEILDQLVFKCPNQCGNMRSYNEMLKHIKECSGGNNTIEVDEKKPLQFFQ
jgi:hypothetical protein